MEKQTGKFVARVLVVEDEESVREALARILENSGYKVTTAEDCPVAVSLLEQGGFDIVFTDLTLPGPSGWELVRWVGENRPGTPVVLLSGWEIHQKDVEDKGPVARILSKPVKLKDMTDAIKELVPHPAEG